MRLGKKLLSFFFTTIMKYIQILAISFFLLSMNSCATDQYPNQGIEINLYMVNAMDEMVTTFEEGEIPILVLDVNNRGEEIWLNPALHYGEYLLLYAKGKENGLLGNFYENGQITNEHRPTIFKGNAQTIIRFPWLWTDELKTEIIELDLEGQEKSRRFSTNTFADPQNNLLSKGTYAVRVSFPAAWGVTVNQIELEFHIQ